MGFSIGSISDAVVDAVSSRHLATSEPFGADAQEVAHEKTLPLPAESVTYHYEQFVKHNPTDVHLLPPQSAVHGPAHPGDTVSLNPQPLPPRNLFNQVETALHAGDLTSDAAKRGIIVVGGRGPSNPEVNRGIIIIGGHGQSNPEVSRGIIIIGGKLR